MGHGLLLSETELAKYRNLQMLSGSTFLLSIIPAIWEQEACKYAKLGICG